MASEQQPQRSQVVATEEVTLYAHGWGGVSGPHSSYLVAASVLAVLYHPFTIGRRPEQSR